VNASSFIIGSLAIGSFGMVAGCREPGTRTTSPTRVMDAGTDAHRPRTHAALDAGFLPDGAVRNINAPNVNGAQAHELVARGAHLVDVRSDAEYAAGHLPDAIHLPVELAWRQYAQIPPGILIVYANGLPDTRSARARRILYAYGGRTVFDLGAMSNW
jgi:rhodanese-related sulfurtransferase